MSSISFVWNQKAGRLVTEIVEFGPYLECSHVLDAPRSSLWRRQYMERYHREALREEDQRERDEIEDAYQEYAEATPLPGTPYPARDWIEKGRSRWERGCRVRMLREADGGKIRLEVRRVRVSDRMLDGEHSEYTRMLWVVAA